MAGMKGYVSRRYLREKWDNLKWDMEKVIGVYDDGEDNIAEDAERVNSRFMCSVCKGKENVPTCNGEPTIWDYCPNCGARMDGEENNGSDRR